MGLRVALGAVGSDLAALVFRQAIVPVLAGVSLGAVLSFWFMRGLQTFLFDVQPIDVGTYVAAAILIGAASMGACLLPARRAARVDPMITLRAE